MKPLGKYEWRCKRKRKNRRKILSKVVKEKIPLFLQISREVNGAALRTYDNRLNIKQIKLIQGYHSITNLIVYASIGMKPSF